MEANRNEDDVALGQTNEAETPRCPGAAGFSLTWSQDPAVSSAEPWDRRRGACEERDVSWRMLAAAAETPRLTDGRGDSSPREKSVRKKQPPKGGAARFGSRARGPCAKPLQMF